MEDSYESMQQEDQDDLQLDTTAAKPPEDLDLEEGSPIAGGSISLNAFSPDTQAQLAGPGRRSIIDVHTGEDSAPAETSEVQQDMSLAILEHALAQAKGGAAKMPTRRATVRHFTFTAAPHVPRVRVPLQVF